MKFVLQARDASSQARLGSLYLSGGCPSLQTPCLLLSTCKGLPHFITPDLLHSLHSIDAPALHVSPLHFIDSPSPATLQAVGGIHELVGMHGYGVFSIARDSMNLEAAADKTNKLGASFQTPFGRRLVGPVQYMKIVNAMKPDIWASLADEVPASVSNKRNILSVDRTLLWLDQCLSLQSGDNTNALGCIVGGTNGEQRKRSSQETAKRNVAGFSLCGFGQGEDKENRQPLLEAAISFLPEEKIRHASGLGIPEEVLHGVSAGIDVFDSIYPYVLTMGGFALTFPLNEEEAAHRDLGKNADIGADKSKINLRSVIYRCDTSPILDSCKCYTCRKHTKAYIHHLLNTHEMLAQILLDLHNNYHYLRFFGAIRKAIAGNILSSYKAWFLDSRKEISHMPSESI